MMSHNCPVCNKGGLPDFRTTQVICPQCNSNLKAFLLLHSLPRLNSSKIAKFALPTLVLATCVIAILYFNSATKQKHIISENVKTIIQLRDTISKLQSIPRGQQIIQPENTSLNKEITIQYKVKKGDYPGKIARFFYNDWRMYNKIEKDNSLIQPYTLNVGQLLTINLVQE